MPKTQYITNNYDSHVVWLGKIPKDWVILPVRAILNERKEKNIDGNTSNILSVMKDVGVIRYEDKGNVGNKSSDRPESYKRVHQNDIVINSMNLVIGSVGLANENGVTSSVYIIYYLKGKNGDIRYFYGLLRDKSFQRHLGTYGKGIMELRESIKAQDIKNQLIPIPPADIQKRIADFLDKKTAKIDQIIAKKNKLIELLKEKRISIITKAVTKGLDPKAKMKPSGVKWIGDIPEGWGKIPIKSLIAYHMGGAWGEEPMFDGNDIECIRVADFNFLNFSTKTEDLTIRNLHNIKLTLLLNEYAVLLEKSGGGDQQPVGRAVRYLGTNKAICSNFIQKLQLISNNNVQFIVFMLTALYHMGVTKKAIKQTTGIQNLDIGYFLKTIVFLPPITEQNDIVNYIKRVSELHVKTIEFIEVQIKKLLEYRSSLIYNAVTGKIKV